jgi:cobaltochelatase CobN
MHLLAAQAGAAQQEGEAIDLGQTPGDVVFASSADSELALLAAATDRAGYDGLRLANLLRLGHHLSVDLWVERTVYHARLVVVRLLGGPAYWPYGVDELVALGRIGKIRLALLPGDATPDPILRDRSTIAGGEWDQLFALLSAGGPENADAALAAMRAAAAGTALPSAPPSANFPRFGLWPTPTRPLRGHPHKGEGERVPSIIAERAAPSSPSPLWGGKRQQGGGEPRTQTVRQPPLPSSPARGEVPGSDFGKALPQTQSGTLPLAGRVGEGVAPSLARPCGNSS